MSARIIPKRGKDVYNDARVVDAHPSRGLFNDERKAIEKYFKTPGRVLDLGCAIGRTSVDLARMGHDVDAIDYAEAMIDRAKIIHNDSPVRFQVMDARQLKFPTATFDYVFFSSNGLDCLYPVSERMKTLREIYRVMKPGGVFIFTSHNALWIPSKWDKGNAIIRSFRNGWIHPYRLNNSPIGEYPLYYSLPGTIGRQLREVGMRLIDIRSEHSKYYVGILKRDPYPLYVAVK
jgi:SAM-dependent methyltransferase